MKKIAILLSGNGVFDGSEIHESVFSLLAIDEEGAESFCIAPDIEHHHITNHITGEITGEKRNVLVEAARIARGAITALEKVTADDFDALVIPGGFGAALNLTTWGLEGAKGDINPDVKRIILECVAKGKPIAALCMGPTVVAKALENSGFTPILSPGTTEEPSPYNIGEIVGEMQSLGSIVQLKTVREIAVDESLKIISAPCYMMHARISEIRTNAYMAIKKLMDLIEK